MDWAQKFSNILRDSGLRNAETEQQLAEIVEVFPFFQAARYLYLDCLQQRSAVSVDEELAALALHTHDREILYKAFGPHRSIEEKTEAEKADESIKLSAGIFSFEGRPASADQDELIQETGRELVPESYGAYDLEKEFHSEELSRDEPEPDKPIKQNRSRDVIDRFLKGETGDSAAFKPKLEVPVEDAFKVPDDLISETLAKIYIKQEKFKEAISVYERLALAEPEKKAYFARLIEDLKKKT